MCENVCISISLSTAELMMMMMIMSGFVERVINGLQTRCRSAEQVGLQMSSERHVIVINFERELISFNSYCTI